MAKATALTRKVGPAPVWLWAAAGLVAVFLLTRSNPASATPIPLNTSTSGSDTGATGAVSDTPADNSGDLLSSLLGNQQSSYDALLAALQYGGGGGGAGVTAGGGAASDTSATSAPTVTDSPAPGTVIDPSGTGNPFTGGAPGGVISTDPEHNAFVTGSSDVDPFAVQSSDGSDALSRYLANQAQLTTYSQPVTSPTPTVVQPAPADTAGVIKTPTVTKPVAV